MDSVEVEAGKRTAYLIRNPAESKKRMTEKHDKVLRFLREEVYTSADVMGLLLGLKSRQGIHATLTRMERLQLVKREMVPVLGGHTTLWGITGHGQALAALDDEPILPGVFASGRISARLDHRLDLQRLRLAAERAGWTEWKYLDREKLKPSIAKQKHRPDVHARDPHGRLVAIERERTIKTQKRYDSELLPYYYKQLHNGLDYVVWVCDGTKECARLRKLLNQGLPRLLANGKLPRSAAECLVVVDMNAWPAAATDTRAQAEKSARERATKAAETRAEAEAKAQKERDDAAAKAEHQTKTNRAFQILEAAQGRRTKDELVQEITAQTGFDAAYAAARIDEWVEQYPDQIKPPRKKWF